MFRNYLISEGACKEALDWVEDKSLEEAWNTCEEPWWMAWLIVHVYDSTYRPIFSKAPFFHCLLKLSIMTARAEEACKYIRENWDIKDIGERISLAIKARTV